MITNTFKEILQQPAVWQEQYAAMVAQKTAIQQFLHKYITHDTDIVLTGAGTSAFIGDAIAPVLRPMWKNVRAVATTDLITHAATYLDADKPLLLISFARSGNSPESVGAVNLANGLCKQIAHIYITCNKAGHLAQTAGADNVLCLLLPDATNDKSLAMTSSFSTMLLSCLLLSRIDTIEQEQGAVEKIAQNAQYVIDQQDMLQQIASRGFERAIFLGSGPMKGIAEECHLKLQELTDGAVVCKFDSFLGFRHGPKAVVNSKSMVVYLTNDDESVQRYERDLIQQVDGNNDLVAQVIVSAGKPIDEQKCMIRGAHWVVAMPNGSAQTGIYGLLPYVLVGQLLGFYASVSHGLCPDTPSVSGNISRVVEGVTIYE
ncbi:MAG: SIS domain-containing protein [Paludibacteraceae bacterium]|nr:SIS domain-containing protein [Paludibacteraceae bacterium]